ncbi:DNA polymerase IV [Microaceticoccus formicicus]|uniref:DNA polymerase IV n=1 Tax=Microaceticoccus formicicus TaxID=3118105 RepID=UPI003CD04D93|nr:DNA polymerase IV [Peptoniphilaceae bacterium AMB_02]
MANRIIFHVDMDAFFASVEELDNPNLKKYPVIVAGSSDRGVVTTANYPARKYGLHSAMPVFMAKKLCPHVVIVPVRKHRYSEMSKKIYSILNEFTPITEMVSLDEAYMDMTKCTDDPFLTAENIQNRVFTETGLTMSIGISYNKFLAKIASDWNKPNGIKEIKENMIPDILLDLPLRKVHGLGNVSIKKFNNIGIYSVEDLYQLSEEFLVEFLGTHGTEIYYRIRGVDNRLVIPYQERKSIGTESTFSSDISNLDELESIMDEYSKEITALLIKKGFMTKTLTVKLKDSDFKSKSRSETFIEYTDDIDTISIKARQLLRSLFREANYRLMGLTASNLIDNTFKQLSLFD